LALFERGLGAQLARSLPRAAELISICLVVGSANGLILINTCCLVAVRSALLLCLAFSWHISCMPEFIYLRPRSRL